MFRLMLAGVVAALALAACGSRSEVAPAPAAATASAAAAPEASRAGASCPRALDPGPRAPEGVLRALRAAVPRTWHYTTPSGPVKLSARNTEVLDIRSLGGDGLNLKAFADLKGRSSYLGRLARRMCGETVGRRTWVAVVNFPESQSARYAMTFAFFARTPTGWKLWHHG